MKRSFFLKIARAFSFIPFIGIKKEVGLLEKHFKSPENMINFLNSCFNQVERFDLIVSRIFINKSDYSLLKDSIDSTDYSNPLRNTLSLVSRRDFLSKGDMMHLWTSDLYPSEEDEIKVIGEHGPHANYEVAIDEEYILKYLDNRTGEYIESFRGSWIFEEGYWFGESEPTPIPMSKFYYKFLKK